MSSRRRKRECEEQARQIREAPLVARRLLLQRVPSLGRCLHQAARAYAVHRAMPAAMRSKLCASPWSPTMLWAQTAPELVADTALARPVVEPMLVDLVHVACDLCESVGVYPPLLARIILDAMWSYAPSGSRPRRRRDPGSRRPTPD
jgi:hypothetical protein